MRPVLLVVGYPERLTADHGALVESARAADFDARIVSPSALSIVVDESTTCVLVHGEEIVPDVVLPRGVNRPWPLISQVLEIWEARGVRVVPSRQGAELCADKLSTIRALAGAGVPVLPTIGLAPGPDNEFGLATTQAFDRIVVAKPARASKGRGVEKFSSSADAESSLRSTRPLQAGMVDHHVIQPMASGAGIDYRVVVASRHDDPSIVAVTRRLAPSGEFVTNRPGSIVEDVHDPESVVPDVCRVALDAIRALGLSFGGVDVIEHRGRPAVLEVNAWPGLAATQRGRQIADALVEVARSSMSTRS